MLPAGTARTVVATWGAEGSRWLDELPRLLAAVVRDWELVLGERMPSSYHYVAAVTAPGAVPAVLKLGLPGPAHLAVEAAALAVFDGRGAVRLLAHDAARGAMLLERAVPGTDVAALVPDRDADATAAVVTVARRLHRAPPPGTALPDAAARGAAFDRYRRRWAGDGPLPAGLVERAAALLVELGASAPARVVVHGDLHHGNVLAATREPWLAVDPHGAVGDPASEAGPLLHNPGSARRDDALLRLVPARIEQLADGLAQPVDRVLAWGFVQAVLSEVWTAEDGGTVGSRALDVARLLLPRLA